MGNAATKQIKNYELRIKRGLQILNFNLQIFKSSNEQLETEIAPAISRNN